METLLERVILLVGKILIPHHQLSGWIPGYLNSVYNGLIMMQIVSKIKTKLLFFFIFWDVILPVTLVSHTLGKLCSCTFFIIYINNNSTQFLNYIITQKNCIENFGVH